MTYATLTRTLYLTPCDADKTTPSIGAPVTLANGTPVEVVSSSPISVTFRVLKEPRLYWMEKETFWMSCTCHAPTSRVSEKK